MANELRTGWESLYYLSYQRTSISSDDGATSGLYASGSADQGMLGVDGDHGILLDTNTFLMSNQEHIKTVKTTGLAEDKVGSGYEFIQGRRTPSVTLEMGLTEDSMSVFCMLLFQKGSSQGGASAYVKTFVVPTAGNSAVEVWANIGHRIGDGSVAVGYSLTGCIATSLSISGAEGERMKLTAEMLGRSYVDTYNHSASDGTLSSEADQVFWDYAFTLDGSSVELTAFDLSISNNAAVKHYASLIPNSFILQRFSTSGSIKMVQTDATIGDNVQIDNFLAGTDALLVATNTGNNVITVNMKYSGVEQDAADENMLTLPFEAAADASNDSINITSTDNVDREIT